MQLLNSTGILLATKAILVLQPTHTPSQKNLGTLVHATLNSFAFDALIAGLIIIEVNKFGHGGTHIESPHANLGLITNILVFIQVTVGITQLYVTWKYGGVENAKRIYKWHRISGYIVLLMMLATVSAATQTDYNKDVLHIRLWTILLPAVLVLIGVLGNESTLC